MDQPGDSMEQKSMEEPIKVSDTGMVEGKMTNEMQMEKKYEEVSPELAKEKGCLSCHEGIEKVNVKMDAAWIDRKIAKRGVDKCELCHFGNPEGYKKDVAHKNMVVNPADFRVIDRVCGRCHNDNGDLLQVKTASGEKDHVTRMKKGLMATSAGEHSGARYLWAAQKSKSAIYGNRAVSDDDGYVPTENGALKGLKQVPPSSNSEVDNMNRNFCIRCHLWTEGASSPGNMRSSGCAACHVLYANDGLSQTDDPTIDKTKTAHPKKHEITIDIPVEQCMHCHNNGGGRIGLSYSGKMFNHTGLPFKEDGSQTDQVYGIHALQVRADRHFVSGMVCYDCHPSKDIHGDGNIYSKKEQQVAVRCETCHGTPYQPATLIDERGEKLINVDRVGPDIVLTGKYDGDNRFIPDVNRLAKNDVLPISMSIPAHLKDIEQRNRLECYACHARYAPQCYGCHMVQDDRKTAPVDWVSGIGENEKSVPTSPGVWSGALTYVRWESPVLGLNARGRVAPYEVGCQIVYTHIDKEGKTKELNKVFTTAAGYSGLAQNPVQPHSISREARACEDCHNNPKALGLGSGILDPKTQGWSFTYTLDKIVDEMGMQIQDNAHEGARPFNKEEMDRTNRLNVCLGCHQNMPDEKLWKIVTDINGFAKTNELHKEILNRVFRKGATRKDSPLQPIN